MSVRIKRWIATLAVVAVSAIPMVALAATSYWSTLDYTVALTGSTRSYTGANMNIRLTSNESFDHPLNPNHTIKLWRAVSLWPDDYIGSASVTRDGDSGTKTWSNVGSGSYYFKFSKANDGVRITSTNVHMWSNG